MPSRRRVLAGTAGAVAAALAGCTADGGDGPSPGEDGSTEWRQPGGTGPYHCYRPDAAAPRTEPSTRWTAEMARPEGRPIIADDTVLVSTYPDLVALDLASGEERWRRWSGEDRDTEPTAPPVVVDGTVYVGTRDPAELVALSIDDGVPEWRASLGARPTTAPAVGRDDGWFAIGTAEGVTGVTRAGEVGWTRETFSTVSALVSRTGRLYVGTRGGELRKYGSMRDPSGRWNRQLDGTVGQIAALRGDGVIASVLGGPVSRHDGATAGAATWTRDVERVQGFVLADAVYTSGDSLAHIDATSGDAGWSVADDLFAPAAGAGDTIYTGGNGFVAAFAIDSDGIDLGGGAGTERWRVGVGPGVVNAGISVADGAVFAVTSEHSGASRLHAFE